MHDTGRWSDVSLMEQFTPAASDLLSMLRASRAGQRPPVLFGGAFDALTARLAEEAGFDAIWLSGLGVTASHCYPDNGTLALDEYLERTREICGAVRVPVLVDAEHGFESVAQTVASFEQAGAAGVCIEDQGGTKTNSFCSDENQISSAENFHRQLREGRRGAVGDRFVLIGRTEALIAGLGVDQALARLMRYHDAGADAVIVHSRHPTGADALETAQSYSGPIPLGVIPTAFPHVSVEQFARSGIDFVVYANQGFRAMISAYQRCSAALLAGTFSGAVEGAIAPMAEVFRIQGARHAPDLLMNAGPARAGTLA